MSFGGDKIDECFKKLYKKVCDDLNGLFWVCVEIFIMVVKIWWMYIGREG